LNHSKNDKTVFWGCFIALITTSMAFSIRAVLANGGTWQAQLGLTSTEAQELFMAGIWPFAISIILFSLFIDKIGYRAAMFFSFACYAVFVVLALIAHGLIGDASAENRMAYNLLYAGSVILALGNGTVEAFINPVVATLFKDEKSKWLNILHAGWPSGLVLGGILSIILATVGITDWRVNVGVIFLPALIYVVMLFAAKFPINERVAGGATYREMLAEFGALGALIASYLIFAQLQQVFQWDTWMTWTLTGVTVVAYALYSRSAGRPLMIFLVIIMMPLAITELGTDSAITGLMERPMKEIGWNAAWVLVYTSAIMVVLRFNAGPVIRKFTPLGLLAIASGLAIVGLYFLSFAQGLLFIFAAATLYGIAKSYFWPTMLGVVAEQFPKGGALTINSIAGIGMLSVGILGGPLIGDLQDSAVAAGVVERTEYGEELIMDKEYLLRTYRAVDTQAVAGLPPEAQAEVEAVIQDETQGALSKMTVFPAFMLVCYLALIAYFRSKGGYKPEILGESKEVAT